MFSDFYDIEIFPILTPPPAPSHKKYKTESIYSDFNDIEILEMS